MQVVQPISDDIESELIEVFLQPRLRKIIGHHA